MKYSNLTRTQKEFINAAISVMPELAEAKEVIRPQLVSAYKTLVSQRTPTSRKMGFPLWLCNTSKTGRGAYVWPAPTAEDIAHENSIAPKQIKKVNTTQTLEARERLEKIMQPRVADTTHDEFLDELRVAGIVEA
jgi:hypothetical protein